MATWLWERLHRQGIARVKTITSTFDRCGIEVFNVTEIETTPEEPTRTIDNVIEN
jgi:hypothetical protein